MTAMTLDEFSFALICKIEVERDASGKIIEHMPQERYYKADKSLLNRYGHGPFVKFKIPRNLDHSGVYVLTVNGEPKYVGEAADLSKRYNMGYGNISPKNCYKGGQETNCRLNHAIYRAVADGGAVELWFMPTADYKAIEMQLRFRHRLEWNRV